MKFQDKIKKALVKLWDNPEDMSIVKKINDEEFESYADLESFISSNKEIEKMASLELKQTIKQLNENKMKFLLEQKIGFDNWKVFTDNKDVKVEKDKSSIEYHGYINESGQVQWANYFSVPHSLREAVDEHFVNIKLNEEISTADMPAIDTPLALAKKEHFEKVNDIYEGEDEKNVTVTPESFNESVLPLKGKKFYLLSENFSNSKKNTESILECEGNLHRVLIPKTSFELFLKDNTLTEGYLDKEGNLLFEEYMANRTLILKTQMLKEFVENEFAATAFEDIKVINVESPENGLDAIINYENPDGGFENKVVDLAEFVSYILENDPEAENYKIELSAGNEIFNESAYFNFANGANDIAKDFLISTAQEN